MFLISIPNGTLILLFFLKSLPLVDLCIYAVLCIPWSDHHHFSYGKGSSKLQIFTLPHTDPARLFCRKSLRCVTNKSTKNLGCASSAILSILVICKCKLKQHIRRCSECFKSLAILSFTKMAYLVSQLHIAILPESRLEFFNRSGERRDPCVHLHLYSIRHVSLPFESRHCQLLSYAEAMSSNVRIY